MEQQVAETLTKNIWELRKLIESGDATARARQMLLRALAQEVDYIEEKSGIPPERRAFIREREDSRSGVLLVHGTGGSPAELRELAERIFAAGHNVYVLRLPGHGVEGGSGPQSPWESYRYEVRSRYELFSDCCKNVYVLGHGFGATLALMQTFKPRPEGLILLAPALHAHVGWVQRLIIALGLDRVRFLRRWMDWRTEVFDGMELARRNKSWSRLPAFVAGTTDDARVDPRSLGFLRARLTHHRTVVEEYPTGGHDFYRGSQKENVEKAILGFLAEN